MRGHFVRHSSYEVWLPDDYDPSRLWPAILFLHGAGERGDDNEKQTTVGLGPHLRDGTLHPPAIVVFPQCPAESVWSGETRRALAALDEVCELYPIDRDRVSLTGISLGGAGVWTLAAAHSDRWSAIAPVCGWVVGAPFRVSMPAWIFHGSDDPVIPVAQSRDMANILGDSATYTEFPRVKHNSWDPAYTTTGVVDWLVKQKRS